MESIIFDFGNVIGLFDHGRTLKKLAPLTDMTAEEIFRDIYQGDLEEAFESGTISQAEFLRQFRQRCRLGCDDDFLRSAIADIFEPNPEVCALIPRLAKRYRLILGSNTNSIHSQHFRGQFAELLSHFDALVLSHEIGDRKPRRGFFLECITRAACQPRRCLFIDDIAANIDGAKACGLEGIVYFPADDLPGKLRSLGVEVP